MTGFLTCWDGSKYQLPQLYEWRLCYGLGSPCDSFEVCALWDGVRADLLAQFTRFRGVWKDQTVFTGVVDECESCRDGNGTRLMIRGRGMAALLLDNEAVGADYQVATLDDILRDHVAPYGIKVGERGTFPAVSPFSVDTGSSEWQVVERFARCYGGISPRFDRMGRLILSPLPQSGGYTLGADTAVTSLTLREQRYGRYSQIFVRDTAGKTTQTVQDADFTARGGQSRKVLTMPNKTGYEAMRYSARYQLERSAEEARRLEVSLTELFPAWPGELVTVSDQWPGCGGRWSVREMECSWNEEGASSTLVLGTP